MQMLDVQPIELRCAVFCIVCSFVMFVVDAIQWTHTLVEERTLTIGIVLDALAAMLS